MPVTARLSKLFYERLGEQVANELVDWFNAVDATYRADLRELNELNFARLEAKLEQRFAQIDARFAQVDARFAEMNARIDGLATTAQLQSLKAELMKWMFLFWAGTALAGVLFR